jgi:F-type H+-transporting ATPase subunit b
MVVLGIADLGINVPVLIANIVNFTVLLVILRLVAWGPLMKMLDERREKIAQSLSAAEQAKVQVAESERQVQEQIETSRREAQQLIAQAQEISTRIQTDARTQAQADAEATLARARNEIQQERDTAIADLRREFADMTISAAEKVINRSIDRTAHKQLIEEALAQSSFAERKN